METPINEHTEDKLEWPGSVAKWRSYIGHATGHLGEASKTSVDRRGYHVHAAHVWATLAVAEGLGYIINRARFEKRDQAS